MTRKKYRLYIQLPIVLIAAGFLLFPVLVTVDTDAIDNLNGGTIEIVGHAGSGFPGVFFPWNPYPENSLISFQEAIANGADGLELDVQISADSVLFLYHDQKLESKTAGKGCIGQQLADSIDGLPYQLGRPYDWFHDARLVSLETFLNDPPFNWKQHSLYLDLKLHNYCDAEQNYVMLPVMARQLVRKLSHYAVAKPHVNFVSTRVELLRQIEALDSEYTIVYEETVDFDKGLEIVSQNDWNVLAVKPSVLTKEKVAAAHARGIRIITFGGKSRVGIKSLIELNPDVIHVNNVAVMRDLLH